MKTLPVVVLTLITALGLAGCGAISGLGPAQNPTPTGSLSLPSSIEARFEVETPSETAADAVVYLELVDTVTGGSFNSTTVEMQALGDGRWTAVLDQPHGSLVRYRYGLGGLGGEVESTMAGRTIHYRFASLDGTTLVRDVVANWGVSPRALPSGRILGQVLEAPSGQPLPEIIVSAGGLLTFTDGEGRFRLDGLPPGQHSLVAVSPTGAHLPTSQGAIVAGGSTTPADLQLSRSSLVQLTFEVQLPEGTPGELPIRLAGNTRQFGDFFLPLEGGVQVSPVHMPELVRVGPDQAILLAQAYAGTDLRYKYTLGDGLWSSERDSSGAFVTRRLIVPGQEAVVRDRVATWYAGGDALTLESSTPAGTPPGSHLGLQFNPGIWFEPLPMTPSGGGDFRFTLTGPLRFQSALDYRYCLNLDCRTGLEAPRPGDRGPHTLDPSSPDGVVHNEIQGWASSQGQPQPATVVAPELDPRSDWETGVELAPLHRPSWQAAQGQLLDDVAALSATHLGLSPVWIVREAGGFPLMEFDPRHTRFASQVESLARQTSDHDLALVIHPRLSPAQISMSDWWAAAARDVGWWDVFFEELRSFLITQAAIAEMAGAERLVVGGPEYLPALPGGTLPNGGSSGVPGDAGQRWQSILEDMRAIYSGQLAWEHQAGAGRPLPDFAEAVDRLHVSWSLELSTDPNAEVGDLRSAAEFELERLAELAGALDLPIILSVGYPAIEAAATGCDPVGQPCPALAVPVTADDLPPASQAGLTNQAQVINAVLLAAYDSPAVAGFYVRGFNPVNPAMDVSTSTRGKPAGDVIWYWYQRLTPTGNQSE